MGHKIETKYYLGYTEVSKEEYYKSFCSCSREETIETDWFGSRRVTINDAFHFNHTRTDYDFIEEEAMLTGSVIVPLVLAGLVVYGTGKLIYKIVTIGKRRRERERALQELEEWVQSDVAQRIQRILKKYNKKIDEYKELHDLGVLSDQELDGYIQNFIKLSTEEIEHEKMRLG